jgi:hypothetical protein
MQQFGGKNAKKTSSDSKRHFTVVMGNKEHGLYVSSSPSSAAKKAVTKLCTANKSKKVDFYIREITQGSKKKTYGPYTGYIEKLKEPIELKGRVIKYKPVAKLSKKSSKKMMGGNGSVEGQPQKQEETEEIPFSFHDLKNYASNSINALKHKTLEKKKKAQNNKENANKAQIIYTKAIEKARINRDYAESIKKKAKNAKNQAKTSNKELDILETANSNSNVFKKINLGTTAQRNAANASSTIRTNTSAIPSANELAQGNPANTRKIAQQNLANSITTENVNTNTKKKNLK